MKNLLIAAFATVLGLVAITPDAEAARFGGGKSFGMKRDSSVMKRDAVPAKPATPAAAPAPATPATPAPSGMSRWLGPLAGLAAGIGLAALFSHLGMGEGMGNILMLMALAGIAFVAIRWLMNRSQQGNAMQYAGAGNIQPRVEPMQPAAYLASGGGSADVPADFDVEGFLRQAKLNFIRLQAANDRGDMDDIREFTAPELFAEIQMQYQERGRSVQETDVTHLTADLLDVSSDGNRHVVSVRFSGQISEAANSPAQAFTEVWHLVKPTDGSRGWSVTGIQQD
jgi:predicted lipid-binding transport protein (Tim44 family)